jgi:integral membrane protein
MKDKASVTLKRLLNVGVGEGISFIVLLAIAMPLKYLAGMQTPVRIVGSIHGVLFIWYAIALLQAKFANGFSNKKALIAFLLSFLPLGTFFLKKVL